MICFTGIVASYLIIGVLVSYTAYKNDWNSRLRHFDQASNFGWFSAWPWHGAMILSQNTEGWWGRLSGFAQNRTSALFERMMNFEWRKNGKENES